MHLFHILDRKKKDDFSIFAENGIAFNMGRMIREVVTTEDTEPSHGFRHVISRLIDFFLPNVLSVVILELEKDHTGLKLLVKLPPIITRSNVSIREHRIMAIDSRIASRLKNWFGEWWDEQVAKGVYACIFELLPSADTSRT